MIEITMTRIFSVFALFAVMFLAATAALGLSLDLHHHLDDNGVRGWATIHRLSGVAAAVSVMFAHCIVITYFVGTSRWCKEVSETYRLDSQFVRRSNFLKRRTFPWAVLGMLSVVGVAALGAAADPGAIGVKFSENWVTPHLLGAIAGIGFITFTFVREWHNIAANHVVISEIVAAVKNIRDELGLDAKEPAG